MVVATLCVFGCADGGDPTSNPNQDADVTDNDVGGDVPLDSDDAGADLQDDADAAVDLVADGDEDVVDDPTDDITVDVFADSDDDLADVGFDALDTFEPTYSDLTFTVVDGLTLPEWIGRSDERLVFRTAAELEAALQVDAPVGIDFDTEWALFHSIGAQPVPGYATSLTGLQAEDTGAELVVATEVKEPGVSCEVFQYAVSTWQLVRFPQVSGLTDTIVENRQSVPVACTATEFASCDNATLCAPGLLCAGFTRSGSGMCMPRQDLWGVFSATQSADIPDDGTTSLTRSIVASDIASVDMDVIVTVAIDHPAASELLITVTNPSGNEMMVWNHETFSGTELRLERSPSGYSGDESVNGTWLLKITDGTVGNAGTLESWSVEIMSRWD